MKFTDLKSPQNHQDHNVLFVRNHFSTLTDDKAKNACYSNRLFYCFPRSDLPNNADTLLLEWQRETSKAVTSITSPCSLTVFCHHYRSLTRELQECDTVTTPNTCLAPSEAVMSSSQPYKEQKTCTVAAAIDGRTCSEYSTWFLPRDGPNWRNWL